jgi:hypothetical protein
MGYDHPAIRPAREVIDNMTFDDQAMISSTHACAA